MKGLSAVGEAAGRRGPVELALYDGPDDPHASAIAPKHVTGLALNPTQVVRPGLALASELGRPGGVPNRAADKRAAGVNHLPGH